jgi:ABC-2 type transport system ATP-binding protein
VILTKAKGIRGFGTAEIDIAIPFEDAKLLYGKLGLGDKKEAMARTLSGGMKRRLMLARALIHEPKLLILDEPTAGVDVGLRRGMWEYLQKLQKDTGMTILLTTHYLEEVEALCEHVTILNTGKVVSSDSVKNTLKKLEKETYLIEVDTNSDIEISGKVSCRDHILEVIIDKENTLSQVFKILESKHISILSVKPKENRLEAFFLSKN